MYGVSGEEGTKRWRGGGVEGWRGGGVEGWRNGETGGGVDGWGLPTSTQWLADEYAG